MGLLEKAGEIESSKPEQKVVKPETPATPEPVESAPAPEPKKKKSRRKGERKAREPRKRKTRPPKQLPEGFEPSTRGQSTVRRISDFAVSYGWCIPLVGLNAYGGNNDFTYIIILGIIVMVFNLGFMPYSTGRTMGNWISRTTYISSKSSKPHQSYHLLKGLTFPFVLIGIILVFTAPSTGLDTTGGRIVLAMGLVMVLPPVLDYLFYRFKKDNLGLWDTLYGGVWMVRTTKTAEAKGWLKRLEQLGDYSDSQGWFKDKDEGDPSP